MGNLKVVLLHDQMIDKAGKLVTTSLTLIDVHDISRSCCTYAIPRFFVAHPSEALRKLARTLHQHWETGFGAAYNPKRKQALEVARIVASLDEAIHTIELESGRLPTLIATSAKREPGRVGFSDLKRMVHEQDAEYLLMLGTGWGMCDELLARADLFIAPIEGPVPYNHLSVRSALAIMLDRIFGI